MSFSRRINNAGINMKDELESYIFSNSISKIKEIVKSRYGYEIKSHDDQNGSNAQLLNQWLASVDPDYNKRKKNKNTGNIIDTQYLFGVDENTFIFVSAGNKSKSLVDLLDMNRNNCYRSDYSLYLYIFGVKSKEYYDNAIDFITRSNSTVLDIYNITGNKSDKDKSEQFNSIVSDLHTRNIDTLFYEDGVKDTIINHIDNFIESSDIYKERDLMYKTGILLHGEPGTGKTSLASAIATYYSNSLVVVDMNTFDTLNVSILTNCINADDKRYIVLLEDIDTIFNLDRTSGEADKDDKKVINKLLQFLDSNTSPNNVIFIATTNHIDKLDDAVKRDGRFDLKVEVTGLYREQAEKMCKSFEMNQKAINKILNSVEFPVNQSKLQNLIINSFKNKVDVIDDKEVETSEDKAEENELIEKISGSGYRYYFIKENGKKKRISKDRFDELALTEKYRVVTE